MKKVLIGSTLAIGLLFAGAGQPSAASIQGTGGISSVDISSMDLESALMMVQSQRAMQLDGQLKDQIAKVQANNTQTDSMSNSQQMDMLRLQSLSNKRNEAFDVMTNFVKKMQDSRSSIIGNMR